MIEPRPTESNVTSSRAERGGLTRKDFFAEVVNRLRGRLPTELAAFREASNQTLLKIHYANERVHYEVWLNGQHRTAEIGLHFEDGPMSTAAYLAFFDHLIVELKDKLGTEIELERWTQSWGHLYEITPMTTLTERLADRTARRLADLISILQPLIDEADVPPERSIQSAPSADSARRWRRGRR
ncbi:MAG: hypothetical protein ACRDJH_05605 [Thermomicrobiales bacterium]